MCFCLNGKVSAQNNTRQRSHLACVTCDFRTVRTLDDFLHKVRENCANVEAMLTTVLEVKFVCTHTMMDMVMNQFRLFQYNKKMKIPQSVMETNHKRIEHGIKMLQGL